MKDARPYLKLSIDQIEALFRERPTDLSLGRKILAELEHRSTERAGSLAKTIKRAIEEAGRVSSSTSPHTSRPPEPEELPKPRLVPVPTATPRPGFVPAPSGAPGPAPKVAPVAWPHGRERSAPISLLASWTAIEALSPQTYRSPPNLVSDDRSRVAYLDRGLPWTLNERSRPKCQLYYQLVLGSVLVDQATHALVQTLGADEERNERSREKAPIAAILVDRHGVVLAENSVAVSSFAWALPKALDGDLASLGGWTSAEEGLVEGLTRRLALTDEEGTRLPLSGATVDEAFRWLVGALGLRAELVEAPTFALRIFHPFKAKNPPEPDLLNSFFLDDLSRATALITNERAGGGLARYLGAAPVTHSADLLADKSIIETLIAPALMPLARWPAPGGHPLVTLQQAAVNAARAELGKGVEGIVAVNGPPGTGKTTLLRDIVAGCVLDRAVAMAAFDDPSSAFSASGQKISAGPGIFQHLYKLDASLRGHEVLVASSNNKAVENISKELPALKAIEGDLRYFKSLSDRLSSKDGKDGTPIPGEPTWGLIAAVLGNATNRGTFQRAIWWDDDRSLRLYLKAARGDAVVREIKDEYGKVVRREIPTVITDEAPPSPEQAKAQWKKARVAFKTLQADVEAELQALELIRAKVRQLAEARRLLGRADEALATKKQEAMDTALVLKAAEQALVTAEIEVDLAERLARVGFASRPGWLSRLFRTKRFLQWQANFAPLDEARRQAERAFAQAADRRRELREGAAKAEAALRDHEKQYAKYADEVARLDMALIVPRQQLGERLVDGIFFEQDHARWNQAAPWVPDHIHAKREALFAAAMNLHRAFVDAAAQRITQNIGVLMGAMQAGAFKDEAKRSLLGDLWSTLFLVVPVISTTFASVGRMLGDLPPSSIGWLLIDEAGQATPQAAVGALMRSKRAIVVGDPLQIPPVVALPKRLMVEIANYFNVDMDSWFAPDASVQTVADAASRYQAEFRADIGMRQVGIPLLVHRRCQEPMFGISNKIAYDGQMVHAAGKAELDPIGEVLGPSRWLNLDGDATSKWCAAEGELVVTLLQKLAKAGVTNPSIYIITPFRVVAQGLRDRLKDEIEMFGKLGVGDIDEWCRDRVGTIHTFQGKEADAVVAVLGAPNAAQHGARRWAAATPNILNVMVSRAKARLYVVGSRASWGTVGHARDLADRLPVL